MGKRILLVEDEIISAMALERMLKGIGYDVIGTVTTGEEAIVWAKRERPDLIAMDIRLSGKMDGIDAAAKIVEESGIGIIFMTGYDDAGTRKRAVVMKPLGFITKPIDIMQFEKFKE